jgi:hypothetical protein
VFNCSEINVEPAVRAPSGYWGVTGRRVLRSGKHSSTVGSYCLKILEELNLNFRSYDFLKSFSYNGPYGRKLIFKN